MHPSPMCSSRTNRWRTLATRAVSAGFTMLVGFGVAMAGQPTPQADYVVGPQDVVRVTVFDEPDLSGLHTVDTTGVITVGFIGRVMVEGLTLREIQEEVAKRLRDGFLLNPQVSTEIQEYREQSVYVLGEVVSPGIYQHSGNLSLIEVISMAGGLTAQAGTELQIVRPSANAAAAEPAASGDVPENEVISVSLDDILTASSALVTLRDGDRVNVPKAAVFFVTGQVSAPGSYVWTPGITVEQAIALAGGYTNRGSDRGIRVRRMVDGEQVEVGVEENDVVQPEDTVYIRPRRF